MPEGEARRPFLGEPVHYVSFGTPGGEYGKRCRSATVTEVGAWLDEELVHPEMGPSYMGRTDAASDVRFMRQRYHPDACALMVANPTGLFFNTVRHQEPDGFTGQTDGVTTEISPNAAGGTWHFPRDACG